MTERFKNNNNIEELLIRLDERTASIRQEIAELKTEIDKIKKRIDENKTDERNNLKFYVTKEEFAPLQRGLYGIATLIITTVIGTLVSLVVQKT